MVDKKDIDLGLNEKIYTSEEVDRILYVRDLFTRVGIQIDDFDKFEQILEGLETYNEIKRV